MQNFAIIFIMRTTNAPKLVENVKVTPYDL